MRETASESGEVASIVHDEIDRLPERYRLPLLLCDLESHTQQEAARRLGWPLGTVKSRQCGPGHGCGPGCAAGFAGGVAGGRGVWLGSGRDLGSADSVDGEGGGELATARTCGRGGLGFGCNSCHEFTEGHDRG